ncbi:GPI ethanolamine phosphate transferase 1 [Sabethes cyaneus]|uniref:GPI ethanolamine phosphate transferase 1 n=1 Tax=Sabethes cyaneus TaxID=53552 RepID=UPI00237E8083|nr:GPI ethanolamine phosphate transferase 1 [Sabethes cyaneus]
MIVFAALAVVVHLIFLVSIFYIYFQTPILNDLPIGKDDESAAANRIVVFVADGLRAASFLEHQANRTLFLRQIVLSQGTFGISHTHVPTESRPGHVALFAGMYEDPSAIFKGWKKNPVQFDSVFNRSDFAFSWGSPDVLSIFSDEINPGKAKFISYPAEDESFSTSSNTSLLDVWVFEKVKTFLLTPANQKLLLSQKRVILFLHLLGLDTAGHVHKPYSASFSENLILVDNGIKEIVSIIDRITINDKKTAYIFTSDHGMTDKGSHGSGHPMETETPFIAWGAGIQHWNNSWSNRYQKHVVLDKVDVPSLDINQADVTPLISTLLGIAIPRNNYGKLPRQVLKASDMISAFSMKKNADQLYYQYYEWKKKCNQKMFKWPLSTKESHYIILIETLQKDIEQAHDSKLYKQMISSSELLMDVILEAIEFYQTYYKYELLTAISVAMIGWIVFVAGHVFIAPISIASINVKSILIAIIAICIIWFYNTAQGTPKAVPFFFSLPICLWLPVLSRWRQFIAVINKQMTPKIIMFLVTVELCVMSFFHRQILSGVLVINTLLIIHRTYKKENVKQRSSFLMPVILSNTFLAIFPVIPVAQKDISNPYLLISGIFALAICALIICFFVVKNKWYGRFQVLLTFSMILNILHYFANSDKKFISNWTNCMFSWVFLLLTLLAPLFATTSLQIRFLAIVLNLAGPYVMLSLSYEPLFLLSFSISLFYWLRVEDMLCNSKPKMMLLRYSDVEIFTKDSGSEDIRHALSFVLYMLISFFGTGNMATVSSFDPNWYVH